MTPAPVAPLVLLHGFTGSHASWDDLRARLAGGRRTIAIDLPGHDPAQAGGEDLARYAVDAVAADLARRLDAGHIERAAVLGYSLGGRIALRFALAFPDRLAALVLESTSPGIADPRERHERRQSDAELAALLERDGVTAFVDRWEALPLWESQASLSAGVRARLRALRLRHSATGLANSLRGAGAGVEEPVHDRLGEIRAPALVVAGARDGKYAAIARDMAAAMPRARVAIVPDAGHAVHLERPAAFASLLEEFLDTFHEGARRPGPGAGKTSEEKA